MFRVLLFLIPLLAAAQGPLQPVPQAPQGVPGTVDGRVTNSQTGDPVSGASVHLYPQIWHGTAAQALTAASQGDGSFHFEAVLPGSYFVAVEDPAYRIAGPPLIVHVQNGQQVSNVAVQLHPLAVISGTVLDADGKPVPGATVTAFTTYDWRGQVQLRAGKNATAGKDGKYTLKQIAPGRYYLRAEPNDSESPGGTDGHESPDAGYELVRTFYPKALTLDGASALDIAPGQDASGTTIYLQRAAAYRVAGRVESVELGDAAQNATVSLTPHGALPSTGLSLTVKPAKDGTFEIRHVVAGSYTLWLTGSYRRNNASQQRGRGGLLRLLARQEIDVSAGDVTGVVLAVLPQISLTGRVTLDSAPNQSLSTVRVALLPTGEATFGAYQNAAVNADGSFNLPNVDPGEYRVSVLNIPAGAYVRSVQYNRQDVTQTGIDLSNGGGGEVDVVLRMGAAEVDGTVTGDASAARFAILAPEDVPADGSGALIGNLTASGTFSIRNVPPGHYYAFAVTRWTSVWQNAQFLHEIQREGAPVEVQENTHAQVEAPVVGESDIQQTATRLGLNPE